MREQKTYNKTATKELQLAAHSHIALPIHTLQAHTSLGDKTLVETSKPDSYMQTFVAIMHIEKQTYIHLFAIAVSEDDAETDVLTVTLLHHFRSRKYTKAEVVYLF